VITEDLIGRLSGGLAPVRRTLSPAWLAAAWLGLAALVLGGALLLIGIRPDLGARMRVAYDAGQFLLSITTGVLAAIAAAQLAQPDRSWRWALLPLPSLAAWLLILGFGCLQEYWRIGPAAMHVHESWLCVKFIALVGLPLATVQSWMLRHAGPHRPLPVQLLGGVGSAMLVSAALTLRHPLDSAILILLWHGLALALVALLGWALGRAVMLRPVAAPR
jgi:hypothetical protein